jgi:hypothetical protein
MRITVPAAWMLLAIYAAPALAERDPQSGAPLPPAKQHKVSNPITDHFYILGGYYRPSFKTSLRVDPSTAIPGITGTPLSGEDDLGLPDKKNMGRVEFMFRLRERHKVRVDTFEANRTGNKVLTQDLVIGDTTFTAGTATQTELNWRQYSITYTYSLIHKEHFELGTGLACYFFQIDMLSQATGQREEVSAATPFPALPVDATWVISRRWSLNGHAAYLKLNHSDFSGWYGDYHLDTQYRWNPNFVVGLGYTNIRTSLAKATGSFPGVVNATIGGPELFLRFSF